MPLTDEEDDTESPGDARQKKQKITNRVLLYNRLERVEGSPAHLVSLLLYLWAPDDNGSSCPYIQMRDTLLICNGVPRHWIFTDKQGRLKRKSSSQLKNKTAIVNAFKPPPPKPGKLRTCLHIQPDTSFLGATVQELDTSNLKDINKEPCALPDGFIQTFEKTTSDNNVFISATWYPNFVHVEYSNMKCVKAQAAKQETPRSLNGSIMDQDLVRPPVVVGDHSVITKRLQTVCDAVARHVHHVSPQKYDIACMRLHFKHDADGRLWLMYCSFLDLTPGNPSYQRKQLNLPRFPVEVAVKGMPPLSKTASEREKESTLCALEKEKAAESLPAMKTARIMFSFDADEARKTSKFKVAQSATILIGMRSTIFPLTSHVYHTTTAGPEMPKMPAVMPHYPESLHNLRLVDLAHSKPSTSAGSANRRRMQEKYKHAKQVGISSSRCREYWVCDAVII
ncbi:hypothetical protein CYMTET_43690 [Cymbomonas tetramitiformis]|uniref:Uncharacterized protein n=1 Tax=Cymbomonas tetramitiformis TaxID=36881 RepID=A0AAE0C2Y8_9CHLO|nr:hypothetical protein CYMTET_43690 [Cymbomonas tetramitiformis]